MSNLFIIGNGFDLSHGLKTSYEDFHIYLKEEYPDAQPIPYTPEYIIDGHGNNVPVNEDDVIGFIENLLCEVDGDKWSNLEASIGTIDFENYIDDYYDDDDNDFHELYFNENNAIGLVYPIVEIPSYFNKWIRTIALDNASPKAEFISLTNLNEDLFLSFNYTKTLECIYGVENVCHIHGVQGGELLFGHGKNFSYFSDENYGTRPGTEDSFQEIHNKLKKNTKMALAKHEGFFKTLKLSTNKIYSYGFSFSEVDEIYIKAICENMDTEKTIWYINDFDNETTRSKYQIVITKCGFKGSFDTYRVRN